MRNKMHRMLNSVACIWKLAVFMRIFEELQSGDLYVPRSEQYDDYRAHFMEEQAFRAELPLYTELVGLPTDGTTGSSADAASASA